MDILSNLQGLLGAAGGAPAGRSSGGGAGDALGALGGLLTPDMLGGLASAFLGGRSGGGGMGGGGAGAIGGLLTSLLAGGGGAGGGGLLTSLLSGGGGGAGAGAGGGAGGLMGGLLGSLMGGEGGGGFGGAAPAPSSQSDRTRRVILALVFAARADGHVDANEEAAINDKIRSLGIGREGMQLVDQAMSAPLDPNLIAQGLSDPSEAMTLYALSFALTDADQFMERSYLDGLATALRIPQQAKGQIEMKMRGR